MHDTDTQPAPPPAASRLAELRRERVALLAALDAAERDGATVVRIDDLRVMLGEVA